MIKINKSILTVLVFLISGINWAFAQTYPFQVTTILNPPNSPYLSDYFAPAANKISANVVFNDFNEPSWDIKLRFTIESSNIKIQTSPTFTPNQPITVTPGTPLILTDDVLADYFNFNNLTFQGITASQLSANSRLPDGLYNFCFEIIDYRSGAVLSNKSCQFAQIMSIDEPTTIAPMCGNVIPVAQMQNIMFQWQLSNGVSASQFGSIKYELKLYEITDPNVAPLTALNNNKALLIFTETGIQGTSFLYDMSAPALEGGKRYLYTIKAYDEGGRDLFKNNGLSEVCWFSYGYPTGGTVPLVAPADKSGFSRADQQYFKWEQPTNGTSGQLYTYEIKIVQLNEGQDPENGITNNVAWFEEDSDPTSMNFWEMIVSKKFEPMKDYAWQVTAFTGEQQIAKSPVWKFRGPGVLDNFWAGDHLVTVTSTLNSDLNSLDGTGWIRFSKDSAKQNLTFEKLKIILVAGKYVLDAGEIINALPDYKDDKLTPTTEENGFSYFKADTLKLNKDNLYLSGITYWHLPHPVTGSSGPAYLKSKKNWIKYNDFTVVGTFYVNDSADYELADPYKFRLHIFNTSTVAVYQNNITYSFNGEVFLPQNVAGVNPGRVNVLFKESKQLFYIPITETTLANNINLVKNTNIHLDPTSAVIDFSEDESPLKLASDKTWKGVYWPSFKFVMDQTVDKSNQLKLLSVLSYPMTLDASNNYKAWVTTNGMIFEAAKNYSEELSTFNTFYGKLRSFDFKIEASIVENAHVKGKIRIPFISELGHFNYTIPVNTDGFEEGYMDEAIAGKTVELDRRSNEKFRTTVTFKQAVFANNERLDLTVDIDNKLVQAKMQNVSGFKIWGSGDVGFGTAKNGGVALGTQVKGKIENNYEIIIDSVYAKVDNGLYKVVFSSNGTLSTDVSGDGEPPRMNFDAAEPMAYANVTDASLKYLVNPADYGFLPLDDVGTKNYDEEKNGFKVTRRIPIFYMSPAFTAQGSLEFKIGDKDYGDCFLGKINAKVRKPAEFEVDLLVCIGKKETTQYWFVMGKLQVANGIPIGSTGAEFSGAEVRLYRHMNHKEPGTVKGDIMKDFDYIPDPDVSYGGLIGLSIQDKPTHGDKFQVEACGELIFNNSGGLTSVGFEIEASIVSKKMQKTKTPGVDKPKGMVVVSGSLYYNIPNNHLLITASAKAGYDDDDHPEANAPFCAKGSITVEIKPNYYLVALGSEEEKISITPGCKGWGGVGWFSVKKDTVEGGGGSTNEVATLGLGVSYTISYVGKGFDVGIAECKPYFYFYAELAVFASLQYQPEVEFLEAGLVFQAQATIGVNVEWPIGGDDNYDFASINLYGKGVYKFKEKKIKVEGKATISILCFDVEVKGEHEFDA